MNHAVVRSGMMFAAVPPSRMIPWTRAVGRSCWRQSPTELNSRIIASSALRPFHGSDEACACRPWNTTSTSSDASGQLSTWLRSQGWYISAASRPSISPSSIMICLPLPRSSAGVPRKTISPGSSSAIEASAIAAPDARGGHGVVAAAVPEPGQRVVLGEDPDPRAVAAAPAAPDGADRGGQAAGRELDLEPVPGEDLRDRRGRVVLLERRLGVGVDPVRELEDLVAGGVDGGREAGLLVGVGLGGGGGGQRRQRAGLQWERGRRGPGGGRSVARAGPRLVSVPRRASIRRRARG